MVITSALHAEGPRFEPERNHYTQHGYFVKLYVRFGIGIVQSYESTIEVRFRSVVVITCASHAQGPRFEPERNQDFEKHFAKSKFIALLFPVLLLFY